MNLFDNVKPPADRPERPKRTDEPLAVRMRPLALEDVVGQEHFIGEGKLLWRMVRADRLASLIFYGPPGTGKTTLAHVIAHTTNAHFIELNATLSNVKEVRAAIETAAKLKRQGRKTLLFIDELHRFNKAQQDVLLPDVERRMLILIGATTHNPFFAINSPLISRSQIFELKPLTNDQIKALLRRALADEERGLGGTPVELTEEAADFLAENSDGDARRALTALEVGALSSDTTADGPIHFGLELAQESIQRKAIDYDRDEDQHYDVASAFIKSMRGSDPDAALYWMAKMIEAGEDPRFIVRRIFICAAEDVGNADPLALLLGEAAVQAVEFLGMPEAVHALAQAVTYISCAPKSNASYVAVSAALEDVRNGRTLPVPEHLRDAGYRGAERLGRGQDYKYAHNYDDHWVDQEYVPTSRIYYEPSTQGREAELKKRLDAIRARRGIGGAQPPDAPAGEHK